MVVSVNEKKSMTSTVSCNIVIEIVEIKFLMKESLLIFFSKFIHSNASKFYILDILLLDRSEFVGKQEKLKCTFSKRIYRSNTTFLHCRNDYITTYHFID